MKIVKNEEKIKEKNWESFQNEKKILQTTEKKNPLRVLFPYNIHITRPFRVFSQFLVCLNGTNIQIKPTW